MDRLEFEASPVYIVCSIYAHAQYSDKETVEAGDMFSDRPARMLFGSFSEGRMTDSMELTDAMVKELLRSGSSDEVGERQLHLGHGSVPYRA